MANRSRGPSTLYDEPLATLGWKYSAPRKRALDEWNRRHGDEPPPSPRAQRVFCRFLIDNPYLIGEPFDRYILPILRDWWANAGPPKRLSAKDIAALVDDLVNTGMQLTKARKQIADYLGMEFSAVERDHQRHRIQKRHQSR